MSAQLDALDLALLAGLREIGASRAARRAKMTILDGGGGAMARWIRKREHGTAGRRTGDLQPADWHLEAEPFRDMVLAACGLNLGAESDIEANDDESVIGRCPACQGAALRAVGP